MKNPPKTRVKEGPAPVYDTCAGCDAVLTSRFAAKHHICRKGSNHGS